MRRWNVTRFELESVKDYEEEFGMLYYTIIADIGDSLVVSVAEEHYDKFLEAMDYKGQS